ncbi:hypothetical protein ANN_24291 [Periplaneta americana]|uniref:Uncharacterized protein n=1 Tax=Periplaneta americana TaxID=6978 RepID=A0ABQ8S2N6_PERAM|nr:hypothetical protein ANN_24291 [Periplaneta americana]
MFSFFHLLGRDSTSIGPYLSPPQRAYKHKSKQTAPPPLLFERSKKFSDFDHDLCKGMYAFLLSHCRNSIPSQILSWLNEVVKANKEGATVTNINDTREEIKRRINMGNVCYYSVEKLLSSSLLSKNLKVRIYKTVILPVLLYGCETWTLTLREEHRFRVFENKMLRKIFGAKRDEVAGEWRKLHNTELHALYSSPDIIRNIKSRRLRWAGHVARMGESRNAYRVLVGRPEGKRPLGRPRRRWEDNIKMDLREVGYDDRHWINLAQDRDRWRAYVRAAMNLRGVSEVVLQTFRDDSEGHMYQFEIRNPGPEMTELLCGGHIMTTEVYVSPGFVLDSYRASDRCMDAPTYQAICSLMLRQSVVDKREDRSGYITR